MYVVYNYVYVCMVYIVIFMSLGGPQKQATAPDGRKCLCLSVPRVPLCHNATYRSHCLYYGQGPTPPTDTV